MLKTLTIREQIFDTQEDDNKSSKLEVYFDRREKPARNWKLEGKK
ncbi:MAG: hypothetical protein RG741_04455 [Bacteroidales bacterium]|nr:hypothetical protein [Bacteroidales bacterium]